LKHTVPVITDAQALLTYFFYTIWARHGELLDKKTIQNQNWQGAGWARGAFQKFWDPLLISATIEADNCKFGT